MQIYINGSYISEDEAHISVKDRALLFGDGVFTHLLIQEGKIFFLDEHLKRLHDHASLLSIDYSPIDPNEIKRLVKLNKAETGDYSLKIMITAGEIEDDAFRERRGSTIMMLTRKKKSLLNDPKLTFYPEPILSPFNKIKTLSYLDRHWVKQYALSNKSDDAITRGIKGEILECSFANLFWIHENLLFYPSMDLPYFAGITFSKFLDGLKKGPWKLQPGRYHEEHLLDSTLYMISSVVGIQHVSYLDEHELSVDLKEKKELQSILKNEQKKHQFSCE